MDGMSSTKKMQLSVQELSVASLSRKESKECSRVRLEHGTLLGYYTVWIRKTN
jgi:hypothetical protein